jgi:hypothetical protein
MTNTNDFNNSNPHESTQKWMYHNNDKYSATLLRKRHISVNLLSEIETNEEIHKLINSNMSGAIKKSYKKHQKWLEKTSKRQTKFETQKRIFLSKMQL